MPVLSVLIEQLSDYAKQHPAESVTAENFKTFLQKNQLQSFQRTLLEGHVTASCWLLDSTQQRVLLTHHKKLNIWVQLGGHADGETAPLVVALTEAREESGIEQIDVLLDGELFDIDRHTIPARKNEPEHYHYDFRFALQVTGGDDYIVGAESHDLKWVNIQQLSEFTRDQSVLRMGDKWLARSGK